MEDQLRFCFKGARNYVQGGDIFDVAEGWFKLRGQNILSIKFKHFTSEHLRCVLEDPGTVATAEGETIDAAGDRTSFWLVGTGEAVQRRREYDEDRITNPARIIEKRIESKQVSGFSVIEQIIGLTKALNYALSPQISGKWVFAQLCLSEPLPASANHILIRQKSLLANTFSTQQIFLDGKQVGEIRFVVAQP